jgi:hypothetical protein
MHPTIDASYSLVQNNHQIIHCFTKVSLGVQSSKPNTLIGILLVEDRWNRTGNDNMLLCLSIYNNNNNNNRKVIEKYKF